MCIRDSEQRERVEDRVHVEIASRRGQRNWIILPLMMGHFKLWKNGKTEMWNRRAWNFSFDNNPLSK